MKARGAVLSRRHAHSAVVSDWRTLRVGDRVEIIKHAHVVAGGEVEEVSQSGKGLWREPTGPAESADEELGREPDGVQVRRG